MTTKQLDNLLFAQGGKCFFCKEVLLRGDASVEHLIAKANGGGNTNNDNCVACCKAVNSLLGSLPLKHKIEIILNQTGKFICPSRKPISTLAKQIQKPIVAPVKLPQKAVVIPLKQAQKSVVVQAKQVQKKVAVPAKQVQKLLPLAVDDISIAVSDLKKRGNARPKKLKTLKSTIAAIVKFKNFKPAEIENIIKKLQELKKIVIEGEKVVYRL